MSTQACAICGPKRISRALCNCCEQYLCRDHLKEHDDLLNAQLEPLVDDINQLADRLKQININSLLESSRNQLDQWKQTALQSIERFYDQKLNELNEHANKQLNNLRERTEEIQTKILQLIREQDATHEQIEHLFTTIQSIEKETNDIEHRSIEIHIRPLIINANDYITSNIESETSDDDDDDDRLALTTAIQTISSSPANADCIASNENNILLHRHPTLCLYDHNLNRVKESHPYSDLSIIDICWSSGLNQFLLLTDVNVFVLDETKMIIEKSSIPTRKKGHWHNMTCSLENLYLTAYKWGTYIYQYDLRASPFELVRRWQTPTTCANDESIDHFTYKNSKIAMIIQNRINNNKYFQLRSDQTLECIWSIELNQCKMTIHRTRFCSIHQNDWLIIDSIQSQLLYFSTDGLFKQNVAYEFNQPLRILESKPNFLLVTTNRSVNLHQLL